MRVLISSQHVNPEKKLEEFITEKVSRLGRYDENIAEAEVVLSLERSGGTNYESKVVKVKLFGRDGTYFAEKKAGSFEEATLEVVDALRRQILKNKEKKR